MNLIRRKREPDRLLDTLGHAVSAVSDTNRSRIMKAGLIAGGLAALSAGSAAISALRQRIEANEQ